MLSTVDMVVQQRDSPRWLPDHDDDDDNESLQQTLSTPTYHQAGLGFLKENPCGHLKAFDKPDALPDTPSNSTIEGTQYREYLTCS